MKFSPLLLLISLSLAQRSYAQPKVDAISGLHIFSFSDVKDTSQLTSKINPNIGFMAAISMHYNRLWTGLRYQSIATALQVSHAHVFSGANSSVRYIDKFSLTLGYHVLKQKNIELIPFINSSIASTRMVTNNHLFTLQSLQITGQDTIKEKIETHYSRNKPQFFIAGIGISGSAIFKRCIAQYQFEYSRSPNTREQVVTNIQSSTTGVSSTNTTNTFHHVSFQMGLGYRIIDLLPKKKR